MASSAAFCGGCGAAVGPMGGGGMSFGKVLLGFFVLLLVGAVLVGGCAFQGYNRAIGLNAAVEAHWAEVENQLQRRFDLIPNLVETVKGVAGQEVEVFSRIAEARKGYAGARTLDEKVEAANRVESAFARLLVIQEQYPELRSSESFQKLQDSLEGSENRLTVARMRFNQAVRELNTFIRGIPGRWFAGWAGVGEKAYFEAREEAKATPKVDFGKE